MKKMLHMTLLFVLIALLAACGGSGDAPAAPDDAPEAIEAATPTGEPTAASIDEPTATSEPTATEAPEPTATPTATPVAVVEPSPTPEPTATAEPEPTEAAGAMSGPCGNPFFPIVEGASWTYNTSGAGASTYTRSVSDVTENGFTLTHATSGAPNALSFDYVCNEDGLVSATLGGLPTMAGFSLEVTSFSGTNFPPADQWQAGNAWTASYTVEGTGTVEGIDVAVNGEITTVYEIVGEESVEVPAGTFDAYKVDSTLTQELSMSMGGVSMPLEVAISSSDWYVEGVGQVKTMTLGDFASTSELVTYSGL